MQPMAAPTDPLYPQQWHYSADATSIRLPGALDRSTGAGVTVGVVDSGITAHPDLNPGTGYDFITDPSIARDGSGRDANPADEGDWSEATDTTCNQYQRFIPSSWHGTHVAGTIAARTNNGVGVAGVAGGSRVFMARALGHCGGWSSDIIDAMMWAGGQPVSGVPANPNPAKVLDLSLGGPGACGTAYQNAINALVARDVTIVVAAGNETQNVANVTPANCNNVVAVAAIGPDGNRAYYSNFGAQVDVTAPGGNQQLGTTSGVLSTINSGQRTPESATYGWMQGTSMAAPHVAGVAALMKSANPSLTPAQIEATLKQTARPASGSCSGCGAGLVDAAAAVRAVAGGTDPTPQPGDVITNPGFEQGTTGWSDPSGSVITDASGAPAHSGTWKAWLGGYGSTRTDTISQQITVPTGATTLSYWMYITSAEDASAANVDNLTVTMDGTQIRSRSNMFPNKGQWVKETVDIRAFAGRSVTLAFTGTENASKQTSFVLDDLAIG